MTECKEYRCTECGGLYPDRDGGLMEFITEMPQDECRLAMGALEDVWQRRGCGRFEVVVENGQRRVLRPGDKGTDVEVEVYHFGARVVSEYFWSRGLMSQGQEEMINA